jgi:hypothetical protein
LLPATAPRRHPWAQRREHIDTSGISVGCAREIPSFFSAC